MKRIFILASLFISHFSFSQYIGVRARYSETRLVNDNPPLPPSREDHLILSFFTVDDTGSFTPAFLSNYDIWINKEGTQYGSWMGGILDSAGNNYPGYSYTAPMAVAINNTLGANYLDCDPAVLTHYTADGHELDCGWIRVSHWNDPANEWFTAPNISLPYYTWPNYYASFPGNVNFGWPFAPTPPYNLYYFNCGAGQQTVIRGVITNENGISSTEPLPVRLTSLSGSLVDRKVKLSWSNLTETNISRYEIERSTDGYSFTTFDSLAPAANNGTRVDYNIYETQDEKTVYYRVKAVESTTKIYYSNIVLLSAPDQNFEIATVLSVYPNPSADGNFIFRLSNADKGRYISSVVTSEGKELKQKLVMHNGGDLIRQLDLSGLPAGIYRLLIRGERSKFSQTVLLAR